MEQEYCGELEFAKIVELEFKVFPLLCYIVNDYLSIHNIYIWNLEL